jgi:hypothetical protein
MGKKEKRKREVMMTTLPSKAVGINNLWQPPLSMVQGIHEQIVPEQTPQT